MRLYGTRARRIHHYHETIVAPPPTPWEKCPEARLKVAKDAGDMGIEKHLVEAVLASTSYEQLARLVEYLFENNASDNDKKFVLRAYKHTLTMFNRGWIDSCSWFNRFLDSRWQAVMLEDR